MKIAFLTLMVLAAIIVPSLAELTDYQKGFEAGLKSGFTLGTAYQQSNDGKISAQQYNQVASEYNALVQSLFAGNQTALNILTAKPISIGQNLGYPGYPTSSGSKPVRAVDSSWNLTQAIHYSPDQKGTIYGYDPDTYYTMVGWSGSGLPNAYDSKGNYIGPRDSSGKPIDNSLQPP